MAEPVDWQAFHQNFELQIWAAPLIAGVLCCCTIAISIIYMVWRLYFSKSSIAHGGSKSDLSRSSMSKIKRTSTNSTSSSKSIADVNHKIKAFSITSLTFFLLANVWSMLYVFYIKLPAPVGGPIDQWTENIWTFYNSCWSLAYGMTYFLFFERLRRSFAHSVHELSKCATYAVVIVILMFILLNQAISFFWFLFVLDAMDWDSFNSVYQPLLWTKFSVDWIFNIVIVYLFCSKIYKITLQRKRSHSMEFRNKHSVKLFQSMIRYFLLTCFTVLSTQIFTASEIVLSAAIAHAIKTGEFSFYYKSYILYFCLGVMDSLISTVYVMLSFPFGVPCYNRICRCCHRWCLCLWTYIAHIETEERQIAGAISERTGTKQETTV